MMSSFLVLYISVCRLQRKLQVPTLRFLNILNGLKHTQAGEDGNTAVLSNIHTELLRSNKRITRIVSGV